MAFTEFYMTSIGSNLNAGGLSNGAEPGPNARYTSTNGNWSTTLNNFRVTDGTNPSGNITVGDFASVYPDGSTTAVYITRITLVDNKTNGNISVSSTAIYGTAPVTSATARSIKVGGSWLGPNGAATFPFGLAGTIGTLVNATGNFVRLNTKNDQTYTMTAALAFSSLGQAIMQGYSSSPGDLGRSIFTTNVTAQANFTLSTGGSSAFADLIFVCTGTSLTNHLFQASVGCNFLRCVFHGARGSGLLSAVTTSMFAIECEAYDCNKSNTAGDGGFVTSSSSGTLICINCYSHDHASGTNASGYSVVSGPGSLILINCIADTCAGSGVLWGQGTATGTQLLSVNSDYYNNVDGIKINATGPGNFAYIINNNFLKNSGKAINNTLTQQSGILYNNGRGAGTQANGSGDALGSIVDSGTDITYASNLTPWNAPVTGDFRIVLASAFNVGRSNFVETDGVNSGSAGHPDIGSNQHADVQKGHTFGG